MQRSALISHGVARQFAGHNPTGSWTDRHQMTMNGKRDGFTLADFRAFVKSALMKRGRAETIVEEVRAAV